MNVWLISFLGLAVFLALLVAWGVRVVKSKFRRLYYFSLASSLNQGHHRVRLQRVESLVWAKPERSSRRVAEFQSSGFEPVAGYDLPDNSGSRMFALYHPVQYLVGVVNESTTLGTWSDVILFPADGSQPALATSLLKRFYLHLLPGNPQIHKPDAPVTDLIAAVLATGSRPRALVPDAPGSKPLAELFAAAYEQAFADAVDERLLAKFEDFEIRRLLKDRTSRCGGELSDRDLAGVKSVLPLAQGNNLRLACKAQFLRETDLPAVEWQKAAPRLLVVHDRTPVLELSRKLLGGIYLTKEMKKGLRKARNTGHPRADFAAHNEKLPAWQRYKKIGEVQRPVPADIYRAPIEREQ